MLLKLGSIVAMASGSVGGTVFSRNRSGAYTRNRTMPVDPGTNSQNLQRGRFSCAVLAWRALTEAQRQAFNAKALVTDFTNRIGESIHPSGMNLFMRSAVLLSQAGLAGITVPAVDPILGDFCTFTSFDPVNGLEMNSNATEWPAAAVLLVQYAIDLSNSTNYYKGPYPLSTTMVVADFTLDVAEIVPLLGLQVDSVQACSWRLVGTDGAASAVRRFRTVYPAP